MAMADAMMEEKPKEEMAMEDKKEEDKKSKSSESSVSEDSDEEKQPDPIIDQCCCCMCVCSNKRTKGMSCCVLLPIKAGIVGIGAIYLLLVAGYFTWHMFMLMNEYIDWYFPVIALLLLVPMIVGASLWVTFYIKDKHASRNRLSYTLTLGIISIAVIAAWNVIYFIWFYKRDAVYVYQGLNDGPYKKTPKKTYVFSILFESSLIVAFFAYAMCVTSRYYATMDPARYKDGDATGKPY